MERFIMYQKELLGRFIPKRTLALFQTKSSLGCTGNRLEIYLCMSTQISPPPACEPK